MKKQPLAFGSEDGGSVLDVAPALYVLVKHSTGKDVQSALVSNRDDSGLASNSITPKKPKVKTYLPADCTSGSITVTLDNNNMWNEFYHRSTEMILTKQGKRMFPYCRYWITGLESNLKYILVMDISPVDNFCYKWNGHSWEPSGKAEPHVLGRVFIHPESPSTGHYWMHYPVSFYKLKLTNNTLDQEGHIILHSMHRYLPRLHLVPADKATEVIQLNGPDVHTFTFPQTEFFAVTAYQNIQITQLKIDYNPFVKGFRKIGLIATAQHEEEEHYCSKLDRGRIPSNYRCPTESNVLDLEQRDLGASCNGEKIYHSGLEKKTLNPDTTLHVSDAPVLKEELSECPVTIPCESGLCVKSLLNSNGGICISIKGEPIDDHGYGPSVQTERILVKQEQTDKEPEECFGRDVNFILEKQLMKHSKMGRMEMETGSSKQPHSSLLGVAKAKKLKLETGTMPESYVRSCDNIAKNMVTVSALRSLLSTFRAEKYSLNHSVKSLPACFENNFSSSLKTRERKHKKLNQQNCSLVTDEPWKNTEMYSSHAITKKPSHFNNLSSASAKFILRGKEKNTSKNSVLRQSVDSNPNAVLSEPVRKGRPWKLNFSKAEQSLKFTRKSVMTNPLGPDFAKPELVPDLEDVDGVLFVSFATKEVLDNHTVDKIEEREVLQNVQAALLTTSDSDSQLSLQLLETKLLEDLKSFRHKQVIHPNLQEVGLKLGSIDPTLSIDLKYLGVQLPLRSSKDYVFGNNQGRNPSGQDTGLFISKTGKTNDFRKIKGWQEKFHSASRQEADSLKNRSAFRSDKLDEYLESERKLMETNVGFSSNAFSSSVAYQLPSKGAKCVQALDSVLKKKSTISPPSTHTFKPLSLPSVFRKRKRKTKNKQATRGRVKSSNKFAVPSHVLSKRKHNSSISLLQQKQSNHPLSLSKTLMKLLELEDCALRDGKPRTYITEDRASYSLDTLLISQVELLELEDSALQNGKPRTCITQERADLSLACFWIPDASNQKASLESNSLCKIIGSQDPASGNTFCKVESICANLTFEKCQPTLPCRTGCTFGCLKRRMALMKGASIHKQHLKTSLHGILANCNGQEEEWEQERMNKHMRSNVEWRSLTADIESRHDSVVPEARMFPCLELGVLQEKRIVIYSMEPDQPVANFPGWAKEEMETDAEPVYFPSPSATKPMQHVILPHSEVVLSFKSTYSGVEPEQLKMPTFNPLIQEEHNYVIPLNFEKMRSYACTPKYKGNIGNKLQQERIQQTPGSEKCFGEDRVADPLEESCGTECDPGVSDVGIPSSGKSVLPEKPTCHSSSASVCPTRKRCSFEALKVNAIICDKRAVMTKRALDNTYAEEELSSEIPLCPEVFSDVLSDHSYISWKPDNEKIEVTEKKQHARYPEDVSDEVAEKCWQTEALAGNILHESSTNQQEAVQFKSRNREEVNIAQMQSPASDSEGPEQIQLTLIAAELQEQHQAVSMNCSKKQLKETKLPKTQWENQNNSKMLGKHRKEKGDSIEIECCKEKQKKEPEINCAKDQNYALETEYVDSFQEPVLKTNTDIQENGNTSSYKNGITSFQEETQSVKDDLVQVSRAWNKTSQKLVAKYLEQNAPKTNHHENGHISIDITNDTRENGEKSADSTEEEIGGISDFQVESLIKNTSPKDEFSVVKTEENRPAFQEVEAMASEVSMYDTKFEENKLLANQPESSSESITHGRNAIISEMAEKDTESTEQFSSDSPIFHPDVVLLDHSYILKVMLKKEHQDELPEDDSHDGSQLDESDFSQDDEHMDTESLEEVSERTNISYLKTTDTHALIARQLQLDHASSNKAMENSAKSKLWIRKPKDGASHRLNHTANEQRARRKMKELFEKLKVALGLHAVPRVAKRILLEQATEEIQRLMSEAVKLSCQKQLLLHENIILVRKVSVLSGKPQKVILKKLKYILAEQKTIDAQKNQEQQAEFVKIAETERITRPVEHSPVSLERGMKPEDMSNRHTKPLVLSRKRSCDSENEDLFMMPRIVNVMSLAAEGETHINLDADKNPYVTVAADFQTNESSLQIESQEMSDLQPEEKVGFASGKKRYSIRTVQGGKENYFPQIVSSLKGFPGSFATELHIEDLAGVQARAEQMDKGDDSQKSKDSLFQKEQVNKLKDSGLEIELRTEPSVLHDTNDLMHIENDETRSSVLNEIAFLNQQLNDNVSHISEFPKSLRSGFSLEDVESCRELTTEDGSPFQFGTLGGCFKDLCLVQGSSGSITPLLLHLEDDNLDDGDMNLRDPSSESGVLTFMPGSEVKDQNPNLSTVTSCRSWKNIKHLAKATNMSLPILPVKANLEPGHNDTVFKPMPKLAPFGLKAASFLLDSGKQNTKVMPSLAPIGMKTLN